MDETDNTKSDNTDRQKLCGSARKRLKLYLKQGMNIEEARILCQKPMKEVRNELKDLKIPKKRKYSEDSNQDKRNSPKKVEKAENTTTSTDGSLEANNIDVELETSTPKQHTDEIIRLAVIPSDFPNNIWSNEKLKLIQNAVLDKIIECKKGSLKPQFAGCSYKPGWLVFKCKGSNSELWVREHVPSLKPWHDAALKVVNVEEVPKAEIFVGYFPERPETLTSRILSLIEGQNEDLSVEFWKVLNRISKNNIEEITFAIDPSSICKLKELGYHISYGYGTVHIRPTRRQYGVTNETYKNECTVRERLRTRSVDMPRYSDDDFSSSDVPYSPRRYSQRHASYDAIINSYAIEKDASHSAGKFNEDGYFGSNVVSYSRGSSYQQKSVSDKTSTSSFNAYTTKNETPQFSQKIRLEQNGLNNHSEESLSDTTTTNLPFTRRNNGTTNTPNYDNKHNTEEATFQNSYRARDNAEWSRRY